LFGVVLEKARVWAAFSAAIPSIVPDQTIDLLVKKEFEVVCMWVVDHVLVAHGVGVTKDERVILKVIVFFFFIFFKIGVWDSFLP